MEKTGPDICDEEKPAENEYWPAAAYGLFAEGKYSRAVDLCLRMLEREPDVISGHVILARSYYHAGQYGQARERFMQVLRRDATNLVALKYLGDILYRDGEEAAAMAYYRRIFEIDPCCEGISCPIDRPEAVETRQLTLRRPGETPARTKSRPLRDPVFITETIGDIYREQGYLQLAREVYRQLLDVRDDNRIAEKLRETEDKLNKKEGLHENTHR